MGGCIWRQEHSDMYLLFEFNVYLRAHKPYGRGGAQDGHLDINTAPEL